MDATKEMSCNFMLRAFKQVCDSCFQLIHDNKEQTKWIRWAVISKILIHKHLPIMFLINLVNTDAILHITCNQKLIFNR